MEEGVCASTSSNKLFVEALKNTKDPIENAGRTEIFSVAVCTIAFFLWNARAGHSFVRPNGVRAHPGGWDGRRLGWVAG